MSRTTRVARTGTEGYTLRISRLTVEKLGVKLYDRVSAVVAELVANAFDADAETVKIRLPLNSLLAHRQDEKGIRGYGYTIEVEDDGHGMTPEEAQRDYLKVGRDRRDHAEQGKQSRHKKRQVMGRKGIGKLAPFGVCRTIEVESAGGDRSAEGHVVSHFFLEFDQIVRDEDAPVSLRTGHLDRTYKQRPGTIIRLSDFLPKRVPDRDTFHRQLARRFGPTCERQDFSIYVANNREGEETDFEKVSRIEIPVVEESKIDLADYPVVTDDGEALSVGGWLAMAKEPYRHEEATGVAIYARGKIVAETRDFEQPAGYTGEFATRSYLVGEVYADWLDLDDGEDLIRTDRQGILWDSDLGRALRKWGADRVRQIGTLSRKPRRARVREIFLQKSALREKAIERFKDNSVVQAALELGEQIGGFAAEDELEDEAYVQDLGDIILSVAPHKALIEAFREFITSTQDRAASIDDLLNLSGKTLVAELASYAQIAHERIRVLQELEKIVREEQDEGKLQELLGGAPWLIEPTWAAISKNQTLKTFRDLLEGWLRKERGLDVSLAIGAERKRPDFTLVNVGHRLHVVEIKPAGHYYNDEDHSRLLNYADAFEAFFANHPELASEFGRGWTIELIADGTALTVPANRRSFEQLVEKDQLRRMPWLDFLGRARRAHEAFLEASDQAREFATRGVEEE